MVWVIIELTRRYAENMHNVGFGVVRIHHPEPLSSILNLPHLQIVKVSAKPSLLGPFANIKNICPAITAIPWC